MNNNYAYLYAEQFGLIVKESNMTVNFYDDGYFVAYIDRLEPNIFNYLSVLLLNIQKCSLLQY